VITQKEEETTKTMGQMEDDYRRIMRDMGYNVLIVHEDQDIALMQRDGIPNTFMPDNYAQRLVEGGISTLNHLLPVLQLKAQWKERDTEVMIAGVCGQASGMQRKQDTAGVGPDGIPIMEPVPLGAVDVGYSLVERYDLIADDELMINGASLRINKCLERRGNKEDITLWVHLKQAQEWFEKPGKINGIFALECVCQADSLGKVSKEVRHILSDTQVFEFTALVESRSRARARAAEAHLEAVEAERQNRAVLRKEQERTAWALIPMAVAGAALWIFLLTMANVRERRYEIGILRALGFSALKIIGLFQLRIGIMAVIGAIIGYVVGALVGTVLGGIILLSVVTAVLQPLPLFVAVLSAAILACAAAWLPALYAASQDPAEILKEMT
ncbi:MAG: ABC transporter permease, partial [Candidatus Hydrogenedentes bacterium]|nr:ABC transporter permease [Candidatus Hydrogenedentota bacterium]